MQTGKVSRFIVAFMLLFVVASCSDWRVFTTPKQEIVSVFFHEKSRYSVATKVGDLITVVELPYHYGSVAIEIYADVLDGEPMWYECTGRYNALNAAAEGGCEIHIRSGADIGAGAWDHGKFGRGQTIKLQ